LHRSAAVLLALTARLDGTFDDQERQAIRRVLGDRFALGAEGAEALVEEADRAAGAATDFYSIIREINGRLAPEERVAVIEMLWEVAYADGLLHDHESNLVRRAAGLLYVSDRDSGDARKRVLARLGLDKAQAGRGVGMAPE
jgi:uncharacterized tellurite resistance protein B-like protein